MSDFNADHVTTAAGAGLLAWLGSVFAHGMRFGGRISRLESTVESGFKALNEKLDLLNKAAADEHAHLAEGVREAKDSARRAHERIDGQNHGG